MRASARFARDARKVRPPTEWAAIFGCNFGVTKSPPDYNPVHRRFTPVLIPDTRDDAMGRVDIRSYRRSFAAVSRFRNKLFAVVWVALWLLATQHCGLEAAGIFEQHTAVDQTCCAGGEPHCSHDGCDTVENGSYRIDSDAAIVPMPQFAECFCLICFTLSAPPLEIAAGDSPCEYIERPLDWVPTWQFVQRAARSPRAPSLV